MRLLGLELKRVLKTRLTWIVLLFALFCSVIFAYIPTTFTYYTQENGQVVKGVKAVKHYKEIRENISGEVTSEKLEQALETVQNLLRENEVKTIYELPSDVFTESYLPYAPLIKNILDTNADEVTGMEPDLLSLTQADIKEMSPKLLYYSGITSDAMDYLALLLFVILVCCAIIAAPVFSIDYHTEADSILRCTKRGRSYLAVVKVISAILISMVSFFICTTVWILLTNSLFGWESVKTSIQMLFSTKAVVSWNVETLQWMVVGITALSLLATLSFVLFLSSKCKTQVASMSGTIFACLFPVLVPAIFPGVMADWVHCIWPSGGIGLQNSVLYDFTGRSFLDFQSVSLWIPYAIVIATLIEIPVFIGLTIHSYNHHIVN